MKKFLALTAAALMLVSVFSGCTSTSAPAATQSTAAAATSEAAATSAAAATTAATSSTFIADRTIEGRIFLENDGSMLPADQINNPVAKKIKELTGITIHWKSTGANNGLEELTLALAAHDLPEVIENYLNDSGRPEASVLFKAAREGMFEDLSSYLANTQVYSKYNDKNFLPADSYNNIVHRAEFNGAVYLLHMNVDRPRDASEVTYTGQGNYPMIRWDILKDLGKTPADIKTWDDFNALCQTIADKHYTDANGKEVSVIGPRKWGGSIASGVYKAFDWGNGTRFGVENGKVVHVTETDWAWKQVNAMRTLNAKGYLNPEYFTMEDSRSEEGLLNGSWAISAYSDYNEANGDHAYVPLSHLQNYLGEDVVYYGAERTGYNTWEVIKGTKDVDQIVKFADFLASKEGKTLWQYGIEGQTYDVVNGQPRLKEDIFKANVADNMSFKDQWGFNPGGGFQFWLLGSTDNYPIKDFGEDHPGVDYDTNYQARQAIWKYCNVTNLKPMTEAPNATSFLGDTDMASTATTLDPVLQEWNKTFVQAVMAKSDNEAKAILDSYKTRLTNAGLKAFEDYLQKKYDADPNSIRFYNIDQY